MNAVTLYSFPSPPVPATPLRRIRGLSLLGGVLICLFVFGFGVWATVAPLESAALATGYVVSQSNRKTVQHLEGGIVGKILVRDGDEVVPGQVLIQLDDTKARTALVTLQGQLWDAEAREARLLAERDGLTAIADPDDLKARSQDPVISQILAGQQRIFDTRRSVDDSKTSAIRERIAETRQEIVGDQAEADADQRRVALIQEEIDGIKGLVAQGLERKGRLLSLERDMAEIQGKRGDAMAQIARARETIAESEINILNIANDTQKQVADELRDTQQKLHELREQVQAANDVLSRTDVRAPEAGIVTDLRVHTPGGVVAAGEPLLDLVPKEDRLVVEARVRPEDIDLVREGLPAQVRLLPYKQRKTPPIDGTVVYVSADRLIDKKTDQPYYAARIRVDENELAQLDDVKMVPGMPTEAMIKTGETTVALYALEPVVESFRRAFREK